ncbi:MAG: serine/threonine protein kinase [Gemmataceae bacterium]|jgi:eukaryotic-like serine/threonine-protein kinase
MELTVQNVYGLILRSKLMKPDEAKVVLQRWKDESKSHYSDLGKFAGWLVSRKYVTEYQASLLIRGHGEGFFINSYKILERLGKGRMGGVYKAEHETGQIVALKVLPPSKSREKNFLMRFHREAQMTMKLVHPNIVRTFETGVCNGLHYMVMDYLAGETLDQFLKRSGKVPPAESCHIVYQALRGLDCIFQHGLVHRDLKPANMMLAGQVPNAKILDKTLKILDMGLGKLTKNKEPVHQVATALHLTDEGVILGTPDYMAPEQARDARNIDIRADIYSLGCVLYHLLTGQPPFPDTNIVNQMIRHATEEPKPASFFNPQVPDGLNKIINTMLAKDPSNRYEVPEKCSQALAIFLNSGPFVSAPGVESEIKLKKYLTWLETEKTAIKEKNKNNKDDGVLYDPPSENNSDQGTESDPGIEPNYSVTLVSNIPPDNDSFDFNASDPVYINSRKKTGEASSGWLNLSRFTRKELVFLGVGVGMGAIATLIGCIIALVVFSPFSNK